MTSASIPTSTPSLVLRKLSAADAHAYFTLVQRNRAHLTALGDYTDDVRMTLRSVKEHLADRVQGEARFGIWLGDALIGRADLNLREDGNAVIGFWIDADHTGHGYAGASCTALIEHGRRHRGVTDVWAGVTEGNARSDRLLRRLGFEPVADMGTYTRFHRAVVTE